MACTFSSAALNRLNKLFRAFSASARLRIHAGNGLRKAMTSEAENDVRISTNCKAASPVSTSGETATRAGRSSMPAIVTARKLVTVAARASAL